MSGSLDRIAFVIGFLVCSVCGCERTQNSTDDLDISQSVSGSSDSPRISIPHPTPLVYDGPEALPAFEPFGPGLVDHLERDELIPDYWRELVAPSVGDVVRLRYCFPQLSHELDLPENTPLSAIEDYVLSVSPENTPGRVGWFATSEVPTPNVWGKDSLLFSLESCAFIADVRRSSAAGIEVDSDTGDSWGGSIRYAPDPPVSVKVDPNRPRLAIVRNSRSSVTFIAEEANGNADTCDVQFPPTYWSESWGEAPCLSLTKLSDGDGYWRSVRFIDGKNDYENRYSNYKEYQNTGLMNSRNGEYSDRLRGYSHYKITGDVFVYASVSIPDKAYSEETSARAVFARRFRR